MTGTITMRLRGWAARLLDPRRGAEQTAPPAAFGAPPGPDAAPVNSPDGGTGLAEAGPDFRGSFAERVGELRSSFAGSGGRGDVGALLARIGNPGGVIRQPPVAAQAVLSLSRRAHWGLDQMTDLIQHDPALSQALLRHANSAWFAGVSDQPLLGIGPAIQRVGTNGVCATVMHHILEAGFSRPGSGLDAMARATWDHMVRTAPKARGLARLFGADPEAAFTLGLLHDVGKLVFFDAVAEERRRLRRDLDLPGPFVSEALRSLHEPLGAIALMQWGFDDASVSVVGTHHRRGGHDPSSPLSQVVFLAEALDLHLAQAGPPPLDAIWESGRLEGSREAVAAWLDEEWAAMEEAERAHRRRLALIA